MDANFFGAAPDPQADPNAFNKQRQMAQMLMKGGMAPPQGSQSGNVYAPPSTANYAAQAIQGIAGAYKNNQLQDAARASNILNGGTGQSPMQSNAGTWLRGMFGGG